MLLFIYCQDKSHITYPPQVLKTLRQLLAPLLEMFLICYLENISVTFTCSSHKAVKHAFRQTHLSTQYGLLSKATYQA